MLEKLDFEKSIARLTVKWVGSDFFPRYFCVAFPLSFIIIGLMVSVREIDTIRQYGIPTAFFIGLPIMLLLSALSLWATIQNNKLVKVTINRPVTELRTVLKKELEQLNWKVKRSNSKYLTAYKCGYWLPGRKIAVLFHNDSAYINVQNLYGNGGGYFPYSFGQNKRYTILVTRIIKGHTE